MIFSRDVVSMLKSIEYDYYILYEHNDDVVLSYLAKVYTERLHHLPMVFLENDRMPSQEEIKNNALFRVKHYLDRTRDVEMWRILTAAAMEAV